MPPRENGSDVDGVVVAAGVATGASGFFPNRPPPRKDDPDPVAFSAGFGVVAPKNPPEEAPVAIEPIKHLSLSAQG